MTTLTGSLPNRLALHTWTLDSTPLADVVRIARETGWGALELRRLDFNRAAEAGRSAGEVIALVKASGLPVACVGVELGWMFADGPEKKRLLEVFDEQCRRAAALGSPRVMSPVDRGRGDLGRAAASLREVTDIAAKHGLRLALEANSQAEQINRLDRLREVVSRAGHPSCGLLLDTYHLQRSGGSADDVVDVAPSEIEYVQYSDVPRSGVEPGQVLDRLPPGHGCVPFAEVFRVIVAKGYTGDVSYEAPNTAAWARDPREVSREALLATRAIRL